jgi:hypothetical protein
MAPPSLEPPTAPSAAAALVTAPLVPASDARKPALYRRWWLWTAVGVAAVTVAVGVGVGAGAAHHSSAPGGAHAVSFSPTPISF